MKRHLAIFSKGLLDKVFGKGKTVDIRLAKNAITPYEKVNRGDLVLIKKSGGKVFGEAIVENALFFDNLDKDRIKKLKKKYQDKTRTDDRFWQERMGANYGSVIFFKDVKKYLSAIKFDKSDRLPWKILD